MVYFLGRQTDHELKIKDSKACLPSEKQLIPNNIFHSFSSDTVQTLLETKKNNRRRHHESISKDQEPKMQSPVPLKLTEVSLRRLLIMNLKIITHHFPIIVPITGPHLDLPESISGEAESKLVAAALVLETIDAAEGLSDGDVKDEVG